jgi:hypothetical protein
MYNQGSSRGLTGMLCLLGVYLAISRACVLVA